MASVIIKGFKSDESAKEFIKWFEGAGEQVQDDWFDARIDEDPERDIQAHFTDCKKTYPLKKDKEGNWQLIVSYIP